MLGTPKRGNFAVGREAQHVDEDELDHRMLSSGEHNFFSTVPWGRQRDSKHQRTLGLVGSLCCPFWIQVYSLGAIKTHPQTVRAVLPTLQTNITSLLFLLSQ